MDDSIPELWPNCEENPTKDPKHTEKDRVFCVASCGFLFYSTLHGRGTGVALEVSSWLTFAKTIKVKVDHTLKEARADEFDAVHLPGGALNADAMRMVPEVQAFLRAMQAAGKPVSVICHAPRELVSSGLVRGRTLTSYYTLQDDIRNAGGRWVDRQVVEDGNWVSSRQPADLPAFNPAMLRLFSRRREGK